MYNLNTPALDAVWLASTDTTWMCRKHGVCTVWAPKTFVRHDVVKFKCHEIMNIQQDNLLFFIIKVQKKILHISEIQSKLNALQATRIV